MKTLKEGQRELNEVKEALQMKTLKEGQRELNEVKEALQMKIIRIVSVIMLVFTLVFAAAGCAPKTAKYPSKSINLIIQAGAGGLSDTVARTVASELQNILGVPVVCANKTGASGAVAMGYVEGSSPDGYTIGYVPVEMSMLKGLGYADIEPSNFDLIARANIAQATITVKADAPWKTLEEFVDYAKKNPGKINVGNSGTGSIWHIAAASFEKIAGVKFNHIPFDGAAPAVAALMGGHVDAVPVSVSEVISGVKSGQLRILGIMDSERSPIFPDVPTLKEKGYDLTVAAWGGFATPKGIPQEVKDVLYPAFEKAIKSDSLKKIADERGFSVAYLPSDGFAKFAQEQFDFYIKMLPELGITKK